MSIQFVWVHVICDKHGDRVVKVDSFLGPAWNLGGEVYIGHDRQPIEGEPETPEQHSQIAHTKYELGCNLCGNDYKWRVERVDPILDKLAHAGIDTIPLARLAARLGN